MSLAGYGRWSTVLGGYLTDEANHLDGLMRKEKILFTQWASFHRRSKKLLKENYMCVVKGTELVKIASPIFR